MTSHHCVTYSAPAKHSLDRRVTRAPRAADAAGAAEVADRGEVREHAREQIVWQRVDPDHALRAARPPLAWERRGLSDTENTREVGADL